MHGAQLFRYESVQPASTLGPTPDEPHLVEHPEMLRDLGLRDRDVLHDRPDCSLTRDECVQDLATMDVGDRVEHI